MTNLKHPSATETEKMNVLLTDVKELLQTVSQQLRMQTRPQEPKYLNLKEAADYISYSESHLRKMAVKENRIAYIRPAERKNGKILFARTALDGFLADRNQ